MYNNMDQEKNQAIPTGDSLDSGKKIPPTQSSQPDGQPTKQSLLDPSFVLDAFEKLLIDHPDQLGTFNEDELRWRLGALGSGIDVFLRTRYDTTFHREIAEGDDKSELEHLNETIAYLGDQIDRLCRNPIDEPSNSIENDDVKTDPKLAEVMRKSRQAAKRIESLTKDDLKSSLLIGRMNAELSVAERTEIISDFAYGTHDLLSDDKLFGELSEDDREDISYSVSIACCTLQSAINSRFDTTPQAIWEGKEKEIETLTRRLTEIRGSDVGDGQIRNVVPLRPSRKRKAAETRKTLTISGNDNENMETIVGHMLDGLKKTGDLFINQDGTIVTPVEVDKKVGKELEFRVVESGPLRAYLSTEFMLAKDVKTAGGTNTVPKPIEFLPKQYLDALVHWPLKHEHLDTVSGLSSFPLMLPDGSFTHEPGLYPSQQMWYQPRVKFHRPLPNPSMKDVQQAKNDLLDLIREFPFEFAEAKSAWLSLILTIIAREIIDGGVPMFTIDASESGSGKGLLCSVAFMVATGQEWAGGNLPMEQTEQQKWILSKLRTAPRIIFLDNQLATVRGEALEAALTMAEYEGRLLGESTIIKVPSRAVWVTTGNQLKFSNDMARRIVPIRLTSKEDPTAKKFERDNLKNYVRRNLKALNLAATTILSAWNHAGRPTAKGKPMSSFESWHATMGGIMKFLDLPDPIAMVKQQLLTANSKKEIWNELIPKLKQLLGGDMLSSREIINRIGTIPSAGDSELVRDCRALLMSIHNETEWKKMTAARVTENLKEGRDVVVGEDSLHCETDSNLKILKWWVGDKKLKCHEDTEFLQ